MANGGSVRPSGMPVLRLGFAMGILPYLESDAAIERDALFCGIDAKMRLQLHRAAREILQSPEDLANLEAIDAAISLSRDAWRQAPHGAYPRQGSAATSLLLVFPILHHLADVRALYAARQIPESHLRLLMQDLPRWIGTYAERTRGLVGFAEIGWLREHISGRLFQIGILQFQPGTWRLPWTLLRNDDGDFALVAHAGDRIAPSGQFASCRGVDAAGAREVVYEERPDGFFGHRALADGSLARDPEFFPAAEWTRHIATGDPVVSIHIPSGGQFSPAACRAALHDAQNFFKAYFPDCPAARAKAMVCATWLLYPDFQKLLPPESNIVGFQRLFLLFPLRNTHGGQFYERVFAPYGRTVTRDKLKTRLQFALFDHMAAGHVPLEGGGVIPL